MDCYLYFYNSRGMNKWELSLPDKGFCSRTTTSAQEPIEEVQLHAGGCKRKERLRCCVRCRQTTKHLNLMTCRGKSMTGEARSNYSSPKDGLCSFVCKPWATSTSFPGSLILPRSLYGAVRWETLGTRLEQRTRRASNLSTTCSTLLAWKQRFLALDIRWRRLKAVCA